LSEKIDKIDKELILLNDKETEVAMMIEKINEMDKNFDHMIKQRDEKIENLEMKLKDTNLKAFGQ
jgi:uncharacterized coiled-coil DUF342 family protein